MISTTVHLLTLFIYAAISVYLFYCLLRKTPVNPRWLLSGTACAPVGHGVSIYGLTVTEQGIRVGFFPVSTLIFWVINAIALARSGEHTSELPSRRHLVCSLL